GRFRRTADPRARRPCPARRVRGPLAVRVAACPARACRRQRFRERAARAGTTARLGVFATTPCPRRPGAGERLAARQRPLALRSASAPDRLRRNRARTGDVRHLAGAESCGSGVAPGLETIPGLWR